MADPKRLKTALDRDKASDDENVINYYFPVEVEVRSAPSIIDLAEKIYEALQREFEALG